MEPIRITGGTERASTRRRDCRRTASSCLSGALCGAASRALCGKLPGRPLERITNLQRRSWPARWRLLMPFHDSCGLLAAIRVKSGQAAFHGGRTRWPMVETLFSSTSSSSSQASPRAIERIWLSSPAW